MVDVVVIGSGGAGLCAALAAKNAGKKVLIVSKTYPTQSQTCQAQGGINAVLEKQNNEDSTQNHINDTLKSAHGLGDEETIQYMCEKANETISWLDDLGVPFSRDENNYIAQRSLGGASNSRACYSSDYTGVKTLHTLYDTCIKEGIEFLNEHLLLNFIIENGSAKGITCLDIVTTEVKQVLSKAVIVATGGYGSIYHGFTTNSSSSTGDSISIALKHGVAVSNMEYVQFHPTALKKNFVLISESARGEGGYLVTKNAERFIDELLPRDIVARAILEKMHEGEEVYLDLRHLGLEKIKESMPQEYNLVVEFAKKRLDTDLIPIMPAAHYTMGGIDTNKEGKTSIENLYAVGECSSNGVHGANRLGGNSLLEIVTFGKYVGEIAAKESANNIIKDKEYHQYQDDIKMIEALFDMPNEIDFYSIKKLMGVEFYKNVGLFRTKEKLEATLKKVQNWKSQLSKMGVSDKSRTYNTNLKAFIEFINMLDLAEVIIYSAIKREESRGAHYRSDFPKEDARFTKKTLVSTKNQLKVEFV
jgi:succinate dehydrogenase / fumarate reductase flavoprotein subunit